MRHYNTGFSLLMDELYYESERLDEEIRQKSIELKEADRKIEERNRKIEEITRN